MNRKDVLSLSRGYRFQWEPAQDTHVLLYPEGMIKLNQTAALILSKVDDQRTVGQIIDELEAQFPEADVTSDIESFINVALENRWVVIDSPC